MLYPPKILSVCLSIRLSIRPLPRAYTYVASNEYF